MKKKLKYLHCMQIHWTSCTHPDTCTVHTHEHWYAELSEEC